MSTSTPRTLGSFATSGASGDLALFDRRFVTCRSITFQRVVVSSARALVDVRLALVIEADSFEFHTSQEAHARDCVRYTALTVEGWLVLRFTWHQVMHSPAYVRGVLADAVARTDRRAKPPDGWLDSA